MLTNRAGNDSTASGVTMDSIRATAARINAEERRYNQVFVYRGTIDQFRRDMETIGIKALKVGPMDLRDLSSLDVVEFRDWILVGDRRDIADLMAMPAWKLSAVLRMKEIAPDLPAYLPSVTNLA